MKMMVSSQRATEFACHSKACAPPPAGKGGSDKGGMSATERDKRSATRYKAEMHKNRQTTVTRGGDIAVSNRGGKLPLFKIRGSKSQAWVTDHLTTAASRKRITNGG